MKIPTGSKTIDKVLEGGIALKSVNLIYGEAESGKTTLAMQLAVNCAVQNYKTLFVDCDGTFSSRRLYMIASNKLEKEIAEFIFLLKPNNFNEQTIVIDQLGDYTTKNFGLIVVDTLTSLYRVQISDDHEKKFLLNRELNRQTAYLSQMAKTKPVAVLITSQVRSAFNDVDGGVEPVATRVLKFWSDTIIMMKPTINRQIISAILEKSSQKNLPEHSLLKIEATGIHDC
jgi:DNA repair protein RadB